MVNSNEPIELSQFDNIKISENLIDNSFSNMTLNEGLKHLISKTQENCKIGQLDYKAFTSHDMVGVYMHISPEGNPNLGTKGAYVVLNSSSDLKEHINALTNLANNLAMQVVALNPKYLTTQDIPQDIIANESKIIKDGLMAEEANKNKKEEVIDKIVKSKLNNWIEENCLLEQQFVIVDHESTEGKVKVKDYVSKKGKELNIADLHIKEYKLFI